MKIFVVNIILCATWQGNYTDPHTHLRYAEAEEYQTIQTLPSDIVSGYLTLRKALNPVG